MISFLMVALSAVGPSPIVIDEARPTHVVQLDEPRRARVDARGASRIVIVARAGWLRVEGKPDATEVVAEGTARAPRDDLLARITLTGTREGDVVRIVVEIPDTKVMDWTSNGGPALDLTVNVPSSIPVEIEDSSGEMHVRGTGALEIKDGSGAIEIREVGGALRVEDGSGDVEIENVRGDVTIRDGSGEIDVRDVTGSVELRDGSGSITARGIGGSVHVLRDGSGEIRVIDVGGDLIVERGRKRGISYEGVKGKVRVE